MKGDSVQKLNRGDEVCEWLINAGHIDPSDLTRANSVAGSRNEATHQVLSGLGFVADEALASAYAEVLGLAVLSPTKVPADDDIAPAFNAGFLERSRVFPFKDDAGLFVLGMVNPLDEDAFRATRFITECEVGRAVLTPHSFEALFRRTFGNDRGELDEVLSRAHSIDEGAALQKIEDQASEAPIVRLVNRLISDAIEMRASDIHIEPQGPGFRARMRVDGILREVPVPNISASAVISRIKILAGLDIAERRLPQDGRMSLVVRGRDVDFRVSTVPLMGGESVVMRILDRAGVDLDYVALGFDPDQISALQSIVAQPHGIILVTGPTGSGKTTTLYTALSGLNADENKILTIEDPIEYQLEGINQSQVNPKIGLTFATALRSFLRQDPDIMMVGEIRDLETAQVAIQSSLTGHLVLSTLHTNDAIGAIARLVDLGAENFLISSTLAGLVAQRLVRKLCTHCKARTKPDEAVVGGLLGGDLSSLEGATFFEPVGCDACSGTGFDGRQVIAEILPISDALRALVSTKATEPELLDAARSEGFRLMAEDGVSKAARGITSLGEIMRVTQGI